MKNAHLDANEIPNCFKPHTINKIQANFPSKTENLSSQSSNSKLLPEISSDDKDKDSIITTSSSSDSSIQDEDIVEEYSFIDCDSDPNIRFNKQIERLFPETNLTECENIVDCPEISQGLEGSEIFFFEKLQLCPKSQYSNKSSCMVLVTNFNSKKECGKIRGPLSKKRNCAFCGKSVCITHSNRKRAGPQDTTKYHRICDNCHERHVNNLVLEELKISLEPEEKEIEDCKAKIKTIENYKTHCLKEIHDKKYKEFQSDKRVNEFSEYFVAEIEKITNEITKVDQENKILEQEYSSVQNQLEKMKQNLKAARDEIANLNAEKSMLNSEMEEEIMKINDLKVKVNALERAQLTKTKSKTKPSRIENLSIWSLDTRASIMSYYDKPELLPSNKIKIQPKDNKMPTKHKKTQSCKSEDFMGINCSLGFRKMF